MSKKRINAYLDIEHFDMLEDIKVLVPGAGELEDSPLIRFIIADYHSRIKHEDRILSKISNDLILSNILLNSLLEQNDTPIHDYISSEKVKEANRMKQLSFNSPRNNRKSFSKNKVKQGDIFEEETEIHRVESQQKNESSSSFDFGIEKPSTKMLFPGTD